MTVEQREGEDWVPLVTERRYILGAERCNVDTPLRLSSPSEAFGITLHWTKRGTVWDGVIRCALSGSDPRAAKVKHWLVGASLGYILLASLFVWQYSMYDQWFLFSFIIAIFPVLKLAFYIRRRLAGLERNEHRVLTIVDAIKRLLHGGSH